MEGAQGVVGDGWGGAQEVGGVRSSIGREMKQSIQDWRGSDSALDPELALGMA